MNRCWSRLVSILISCLGEKAGSLDAKTYETNQKEVSSCFQFSSFQKNSYEGTYAGLFNEIFFYVSAADDGVSRNGRSHELVPDFMITASAHCLRQLEPNEETH